MTCALLLHADLICVTYDIFGNEIQIKWEEYYCKKMECIFILKIKMNIDWNTCIEWISRELTYVFSVEYTKCNI